MLPQCGRVSCFGVAPSHTRPPTGARRRHETCRTLCQGNGIHQRNTPIKEVSFSTLDFEKQHQISAYLELLLEKNEVMNLTAVKGMEEAITRHANDSLTMIPMIEANHRTCNEHLRVIDVGSGAGLPGVMLAIARNQWQVTVLDAMKKRCSFVDEAIAKCGIDNVKTLWARAEEAGRMDDHREVYDVSIARAVAELRVLVEYCLPFLKVGGLLVAAKGPVVEEEVESACGALGKLGGDLVGVFEVNSFSGDGKRTVVVIQKISATSSKYPRRPGIPSKRPL